LQGLQPLASLSQRLKADDLARDSLIMVTAGFASGLFSYLYQLSMGILLTPEDYGALFSLTSLLVIVCVFTRAVTLTVAKLTSKFKAEGRPGAINYIWHSSLKRGLLVGVLSFALLAGLSPLLSLLLNIDSYVYPMILFASLIFAFSLSGNWGIMQGTQRFRSFGSSQVLWAFLKPAFAVPFVYFGFGVAGGLAALPLSFAVVFILTFFLLHNLSQAGKERVELGGFRAYAGFTILAMFGITALTNLDVVLAKHYLAPADAGCYSAVSVLGMIATLCSWRWTSIPTYTLW